MTKAYDLADLVSKLKKHGLDIGEEVARAIVEETLNWTSESAVISENKIDDLLAPLMLSAKPLILQQIDKINGTIEG